MAASSPLTTATSISSPSSNYIARDSPRDADTTGISSPAEEDCSMGPRFRDAVPPVHELEEHCRIHLEESIFLPTIHLYDTLLTDGAGPRSKTATRPAPARVAPPSQLALLSTLAIHPNFTSRPTEISNCHTSARALAYLRAVLALTGPVNARLRYAFVFRRSGRGCGRSPNTDGGSISGDNSSESDCVEGSLANEQSVWRRAPDFWAALGWAFRCAALHPERWRHWKGWVEYMVEVLEADWDERLELDLEREGGDRPVEHKMLQESLLVAYLDDLRRERKNVPKEVLRALMAFTDDDPSDKTVYREVFDRELVTGSPRKAKRKRAPTVVDLEKDQFGDYLDWGRDDFDLDLDLDSDEENGYGNRSNSPTPSKPKSNLRDRARTKRQGPQETTPAVTSRISDGTADTIPLRLRLFRLLSAASDYLPDRLCGVGDLYGQFADRARGSSLPVFRLLVEPQATPLPAFAHVSLLRHLADELLPMPSAHGRPDPAHVDPDTDADHGLSLAILERCFLPFAAGRVTADDNAKLSLVLESMVWFIYRERDVVCDGALAAAVEKGIRARQDKIRRKAPCRDAGAGGPEREAREVLDRSAASLRVFVMVAGVGGEDG